jgi:ribosomal protein S18 acetylase RimI-like enzyme
VSDDHLTRVPPGDARERYLHLLLLADESPQQVRSYIHRGDLFAYSPAAGADAAGIVLAIPAEPDVVELKAVAVEPQHQRQGIGRQMLAAVLDHLRARGCKRVIVGTANAAIGELAFYQKAGFRLLRIERDFFTPARGYPPAMVDNGIPLRDMVWMDQTLDG